MKEKIPDLELIKSSILNPRWKGFTLIETSGRNQGRIIIDQITKKQGKELIEQIKKKGIP